MSSSYGLGKTSKNPASGEIPQYIAQVRRWQLKVRSAGPSSRASRSLCRLIAGIGRLYQINVVIRISADRCGWHVVRVHSGE